jgi:23S rRNA (cytidine1920-2'-O)/16S rRNA (cytidine1409-2'-O)-methyltransferase
VATAVTACGWTVAGVTPSPLLGPAGNVEFLLHLERGVADSNALTGRIQEAVAAARCLVRGH